MRTFDTVIQNLNQIIQTKNPEALSSSWISSNSPSVYSYIQRHVRTESGDIDWDTVTVSIDRSYARRWTRYKYKQVKFYEQKDEVDAILAKYKDKLYTFLCSTNKQDEKIQDRMIISLVRLGQKGNICAVEELIEWVTYLTNDWIDRYPQIYKWQGYADEVAEHIRGCVRRYRYTGSFLGYLFKTLEFSARGKPPLVSLDDKMFDGAKTRIDYTIV